MDFLFIYGANKEKNIYTLLKYLENEMFYMIVKKMPYGCQLKDRYDNKINITYFNIASIKAGRVRGYKVNGILIDKVAKYLEDDVVSILHNNITPRNLFGFNIRYLNFDNDTVEYCI